MTSNFIEVPSKNLTLLISSLEPIFFTSDGMRTVLENTVSSMSGLNKMFLTLTPKFSTSEQWCLENEQTMRQKVILQD